LRDRCARRPFFTAPPRPSPRAALRNKAKANPELAAAKKEKNDAW